MTEIYKQAVRDTLTAEAAERLLTGDTSATDDAGYLAIDMRVVEIIQQQTENLPA